MDSILLVTKNPPETLIVPISTAKEATIRVETSVKGVDNNCIAPPIKIIPLIALAPDIKGVWRTEGTFFMTSKPIKILNTMTYHPSMGDK